ncbi:MAG: ribonuclease P protein component [Rubrivivax sp.]|nr:ribonuclease P protein component [Rubrivivax sp.]
MAAPVWSRSAHFALHHLAQRPQAGGAAGHALGRSDLSTELSESFAQPVDKLVDGRWVGAVLPKRLARRAATRSLLKRHVREAFRRHEVSLEPGMWLIRLRRPVARGDFVSAQSSRLAKTMRAELDALLAAPFPPAVRPPAEAARRRVRR